MRRVVCCLPLLLLMGFVANAAGEDNDSVNGDRLRAAKAALDKRMQARREAGWKPKSPEEQLLIRLRALQRKWEYKQDRAAQRSAFEQAKSEVYVELAKHFAFVSRRYYYYDRVVVQNPITGEIGIVGGPRAAVSYDPLAAALALRWGDMGARSAGIAAAQEYRANTYLARQISNTRSRVAALEASLNGPAVVARGR